MFRRKTRNSTAYTGVGYAGPSAQAPNNSAMAAALTIGQNLKQTQPDVYGKPGARANSDLQPPRARPGQGKSGSLLKRSSSIQSGVSGSLSNAVSSTPKHTRTGSNISQNRHSYQSPGHGQVYSVDDSFNDSFLEEVGHETDAHYSNEAQLRDLRLHHQPPAPPVVKMVKKYIPTPNGIKVVEVPEESMKKEIARSNSMRSNLSAIRSGSISRGNRSHSFTNAAKAKQGNRSRLSSLVGTPKIDENSELDFQRQQNESAALQRQIEHERRVAQDLERQRREYEQLRQLRAENERKMRELQSLQEEDTASFRDASSFEDRTPLSNGTAATSGGAGKGYLDAPEGPHGADDESVYDEEDVPIEPVAFVVDELDSKKINGDGHINGAAVPTLDKDTDSEADQASSPHDAIIDSYDASVPVNEVEVLQTKEEADNFGIEEIPAENFDSPNLASQLRPAFVQHSVESSPERNNTTYEFVADYEEAAKEEASPAFHPVPEIIGTQPSGSPNFEAATETDSLVAPPAFAGSIRSFSSVDSKSRPIKSAMKNSRPAYSQSNSSSEHPAHQAYLSLTTAENTRLNSKLSAPQLQESPVPEPKSPNPPTKRMSQSLRKQPSAASQGGLAGRSLRPQSVIDSNVAPRTQPGGMSSRNLKGFASPATQPIAPHPTSKPNYQSPSKLRAAELYAKANKRPVSEFQARQRKSSFSRDPELPERANVNADVPPRSAHRMTLRAPVSVPQNQTAAPVQQASHSRNSSQQQQPFGGKGFRSKFADSDDESGPNIGQTSNGFSSRFADSDDEGAAPRVSSSNRASASPIRSLRKKEEREPEPKAASKEKKPKKKFLKKLFGRN